MRAISVRPVLHTVQRWVGCLALVVILLTSSRADDTIRRAPRILKGSDHGVGQRVENVILQDITGETVELVNAGKAKATVIFLTGTGCPLCRRYSPTLAKIEQEYADRDIRFIYVNPNRSEKIDRVTKAAETHGFQAPYVRDTKHEALRALKARTTTEAFVIDAAQTLVYRGAVDDQYGIGFSLDAPRNAYLKNAINAVLCGERPDVEATWAPGCELWIDDEETETSGTPPDTSSSGITWHNRVSRIVQNNCGNCHREGGLAPFALDTLEAVTDYAGMIDDVVRRATMPPWFASTVDHNPDAPKWANDCSLSDSDRTDLLAWLETGLPEGDPAHAPLPREYPADWEIGPPELVVQLPEPITIQATGQMPYEHIRVETNLNEGRWIKAVEVQPTARSVVHHVLVFLEDENGEADGLRQAFVAAYVPGNTHQISGDTTALWLPANAVLRFQMHYTPDGIATTDQTRLGLIFSDEAPRHALRGIGIANGDIEIPAGASNHAETASVTFDRDVRLITLNPHMHLRGKAFRYDLILPDGKRERLLDVPRYDFNWQLSYRPVEPIAVPAGSTVEVTGWYDNSEANPANPDPTTDVYWGDQTDEEMLLGYVNFYVPSEVVAAAK